MKDISEIAIITLIVCSMALATAGLITHEITITKEEIQIPTISEEEKYFDKLTEDIIQCESQGKMVWGDLNLKHKAYGVAQFQERTFKWLCELSGKDLNYYSAEDQKELLRWALENNYGRMWTCYEIVKFK
jgi:hypothetical protein